MGGGLREESSEGTTIFAPPWIRPSEGARLRVRSNRKKKSDWTLACRPMRLRRRWHFGCMGRMGCRQIAQNEAKRSDQQARPNFYNRRESDWREGCRGALTRRAGLGAEGEPPWERSEPNCAQDGVIFDCCPTGVPACGCRWMSSQQLHITSLVRQLGKQGAGPGRAACRAPVAGAAPS